MLELVKVVSYILFAAVCVGIGISIESLIRNCREYKQHKRQK